MCVCVCKREKTQHNSTLRKRIALQLIGEERFVEAGGYVLSMHKHIKCVCVCEYKVGQEEESVGQCALDKIAATCLAPVCYSHHTIVVKTPLI